jgi:hypothetical protein
LAKCTRNEKGVDVTPEGNEIVTAGMYYILIVNPKTGEYEQAALSMSATQLKRSRRWNTMMSSITIPGPGGAPLRPPMFFTCYKLTTEFEKNDKGDWMSFAIAPHCSITQLPGGDNLYRFAREFKKMIVAGTVKLAHEDPSLQESGEQVPF